MEVLVNWIHNSRKYVESLVMPSASASGAKRADISCACAYSGTAVWNLGSEALLAFWKTEFGFDDSLAIVHAFTSESNEAKASFLSRQHKVPLNFVDALRLPLGNSLCSVSGCSMPVPWVSEFHGGWYTPPKAKTKMSSGTSCSTECQAELPVPIQKLVQFIMKTRPLVSYLEDPT